MKHFLDLSEWSSTDLRQMIRLAMQLKLEWQSGGNRPVLAGKTLGMIFQKPSLRTRVSFDVGMQHLGGHAREQVGAQSSADRGRNDLFLDTGHRFQVPAEFDVFRHTVG